MSFSLVAPFNILNSSAYAAEKEQLSSSEKLQVLKGLEGLLTRVQSNDMTLEELEAEVNKVSNSWTFTHAKKEYAMAFAVGAVDLVLAGGALIGIQKNPKIMMPSAVAVAMTGVLAGKLFQKAGNLAAERKAAKITELLGKVRKLQSDIEKESQTAEQLKVSIKFAESESDH